MSDALSFYGPVTATWAQPEACAPAVVAAVSTVCGEAVGTVALNAPSAPATVDTTEVAFVVDPG
jgi:hypothetical protein